MPELGFNLVDVAQGLLVIIAGVLAAIGVRKGSGSSRKSVEVATEVAGALVDSTAANKLTAAIDHHAGEIINTRKNLSNLVSELREVKDELRELRSTLVRLGDILLTRR